MTSATRIIRLDENVVNRIAAGEIIQRPSNALKELLENSLDSGASSIVVSAKNGGMKMLQIHDNGCGIDRDDLKLLCERYTTSKLSTFDDLRSIRTFGFRGEALASISHVSRLNVTTRTSDNQCAYRATYQDGALCTEPCASAGSRGTLIQVEDLFYNMPIRRQALSNASEEFGKMLHVMCRYAVHNAGVAFTLRRHGEMQAQLKTQADATCLDNIGCAFGQSIVKHLTGFELQDERLSFRVGGYISNINYTTAKKCTFILFINGRLVESNLLKNAIEHIYGKYLPRGSAPFVYLALQLPCETIDVNVHPNKSRVNFLHEDRIVERIQGGVDAQLSHWDTSRTFYTQSVLSSTLGVDGTGGGGGGGGGVTSSGDTRPSRLRPQYLVRTDCREQKLEALAAGDRSSAATSCGPHLPLTSVRRLCSDLQTQCHSGLRRLLADHKFVGVVNWRHSLVQHDTRLYLLNHQRLGAQLVHQLCLYQMGALGRLVLEPAPSCRFLCETALELPHCRDTAADSADAVTDRMLGVVLSHADMLEDYFSITVDGERLSSVTLPLQELSPPLLCLSLLLPRLATEVEWREEQTCLEQLCRQVAYLYFPDDQSLVGDCGEQSSYRQTVEHVLFPAFRSQLLPPSSMADDGTFVAIANLPDLYKIFERC